jgi:hypothetical protein
MIFSPNNGQTPPHHAIHAGGASTFCFRISIFAGDCRRIAHQ